jgi:hypothetical protein
MSNAVLVGLVVVATLACPLMMWWQSRRGRTACCIPARSDEGSTEVEALRVRQERLAARIAELEGPRDPKQPLERVSGDT